MAPIPTHLRGRAVEPAWSDPHCELDTSWQWRGGVACIQHHRHLQIKYYGELIRGNQIADEDDGRQVINLECASCDDKFVGFDAELHGHDAGLGYVDASKSDRTAKHIFQCKCGSTTFDIAAGVFYHPADDMDEEPAEGDIGNLFESIAIEAKCIACGEQYWPVEYETA